MPALRTASKIFCIFNMLLFACEGTVQDTTELYASVKQDRLTLAYLSNRLSFARKSSFFDPVDANHLLGLPSSQGCSFISKAMKQYKVLLPFTTR
eukprot:IDg19640t1